MGQCGIKGQVPQIGLLGQAVGRIRQPRHDGGHLLDVSIEGVLISTVPVVHQGALRIRGREGAAPCGIGRCVA